MENNFSIDYLNQLKNGQFTKYCDECDSIVRLTEDGYCRGCGKHADNMKNELVNLTVNELENYINNGKRNR